MQNTKPTQFKDLIFSSEDLDFFEIEDPKECVISLRKHFFPRLEFLMEESLKLVKELYQVDFETGMSNAYSPNNRLDAANIVKPNLVMIGRTGKRRSKRNNEPLQIKNLKNKPVYIHPAYLCYNYNDQGFFFIEFSPFRHSISPIFVENFRKKLQENLDIFLANSQNIILNFGSSDVVEIKEEAKKFIEKISTPRFGISQPKDFGFVSFFGSPKKVRIG